MVCLTTTAFAGCTGLGIGEKECWKCENGIAKSVVVEDTVDCGTDIAIDYIYDIKPDCSNAIDLTTFEIIGDSTGIIVTEDKIAFNQVPVGQSTLIRKAMTIESPFTITFKMEIFDITMPVDVGVTGPRVGVMVTNDATFTRQYDASETDTIGYYFQSWNSSSGEPYYVHVIRDFTDTWGNQDTWQTYFGGYDIEYEVQLSYNDYSIDITMTDLDTGDVVWIDTITIDDLANDIILSDSFSYFIPFINYGSGPTTRVISGEFYDFTIS